MKSAINHSFYNIEPLRPWLEAGVPVITPNYRLARRIKLGWGQVMWEEGRRAWTSPPVMSLEHWWLHCLEQRSIELGNNSPDIRLASEQQELMLWQNCISENPKSEQLLRPQAAAQLARQAWHNLMLWQVDCEQADIQAQFRETADGSLFLEWLADFRERLNRSGLSVLPVIARHLVAGESETELVLVEFDELPPLYECLLDRQAQSVHRHSCLDERALTLVRACANSRDELRQAADWARTKAGSVAILVPDLAQRRQTVERVLGQAFDCPSWSGDSLPVNISAGISLNCAGPVKTALGLLSLHSENSTVDELAALLHSRYRPREEEDGELQLLRRLYRIGRDRVTREDLRYWCSRELDGAGLALGEQLLALSADRELQGRQPPGQWMPLFSRVLQSLGWPGTSPLDSAEYQQVEHWYRALEQLAELDAVSGPVTYGTALQILQRLCAARLFQPQTADAKVQVLGLLEAAGLQFDHIWICGMSTNAWPPAPEPNPFIPVALQRSRHMPHADADREHQYAARQLQRFRSSCGELVASYALLEDDIPLQPSALLTDFDGVEVSAATQPVPPLWRDIMRQGACETLSDKRAPAVGPEERSQLRGGSGLIGDQSQCPFRAFVHHRLHGRALGELGVALDPAQRGTLLHEALFRLWGMIESQQQLSALHKEEIARLAASAAEEAVGEFSRRFPAAAGRRFLDLEQRRLQRLLEQWLDVELQREPFTVLEREGECRLQLGELQLKLRIDRIDAVEGGSMVIDYKSGASTSQAWLGMRPEQPQLPLYSLLPGRQTAGLAFAKVRLDESAYEGLALRSQGPGISEDIKKKTARSDQPVEHWEDLQALWRENLERIAREFLEGGAAVAPLKPATCTYCGLQALCRIGAEVE